MLEKLSWLHLSDLHLRANKDKFSQEVLCEAIKRDVPSRLSDEFPVQFIFVTGDIAFSGQSSEYEVSTEFLSSLSSDLELETSRLCIVPGNHDVDRSLQTYMYEGVKLRLNNQQAVDEFLARSEERTQLMERQSAFRDFRRRMSPDNPSSETHDGLAHVQRFEINGLRVSVLELNTAWLSGNKDRQGELLLGERQVISALALTEAFEPHLTVALAHHPPDWLVEYDRISCTNRLVPHLDIFHSGHLHGHQASVMLIPSSQCLHSAAGSSHETRHCRNSYNLVEYDIGSALCRIRQFEYRSDTGSFWEVEGMKYTLPSAGDFPFSATEIAVEFRKNVQTAEPYADYMATLLTGDLDEVPIKLDSQTVVFASRCLPPEFQFQEVQDFLRISNLLRVYNSTPLCEVVSSHLAAVTRLAELLNRLSKSDSEFAENIGNRIALARKLSGTFAVESRSYQEQYLDELAAAGALSELIETSTRYVRSSEATVRIAAKRHLALALLQSEDQECRKRGIKLAFQNLDEDWAAPRDYCVASAAAESISDNGRAECTALKALEKWPSDPVIEEYCRSLAVQTGSQVLRQRLVEIGGNG